MDFVTVVAGVPRSGTSLLMQMLGAGGLPLLTDGVREADADNPRGYFELEVAKRTREDARWVLEARGRAVKLVHALVPFLPEGERYRVILLRRDLHEVLASQRVMLERRGHADSGAPGDPPESRLGEIFRSQLDETARWVERQPGAALLEVSYAEVVAAPAAAAAEIARFLGGGLDEAAMAAAVDPALWRQRTRPTQATARPGDASPTSD